MASNSMMKELWLFLGQRKKYWMVPLILVMMLVGAVFIFAQGSALAPFIYTIF